MTNYDYFLKFLEDNYNKNRGDFDNYYRVGNYEFMVTHQNNEKYWKHCCSTREEWDKKEILLFYDGWLDGIVIATKDK